MEKHTPFLWRHILSLCCVFGCLIAGVRGDNIPPPQALHVPAALATRGVALDRDGAIAQIKFSGKTSLPGLLLDSALGADFTVNLWFFVPDNASALFLNDGPWTDDRPMTLFTLKSVDEAKRLVVRLPGGRVAVGVIEPGFESWRSFMVNAHLSAGAWYMLSLVCNGTTLDIYLNGALAARQFGTGNLAGMAQIDFGRFGNMRFFEGSIVRPQIFNTAFSPEQIRGLFEGRPLSVQKGALGAVSVRELATYGRYPSVQVAEGDSHPLIEQLHLSATVLPMAGRQDLLVCGKHVSYFGWRLAYYQQQGTGPDGLPYYGEGQTISSMPGTQFMAAPLGNGYTDLYARGEGTPYGAGVLLQYRNSEPNRFSYASARPVLIGGKHFGEAFAQRLGGWYVGDVDGDGIVDLLVATIKPGGSNYWPDKKAAWTGGDQPNTGKDRGYDVQGKWLGGECVSELFWAKGARAADGGIDFSAPRSVSYRVLGYPLQWKAGESERALAILPLKEGPVLLHTGSVDQIMAMPYRIENGEMICEEARGLLENNAAIAGTYFVHSIAQLSPTDNGQSRLLLDGNPGRLIVLEGERIGKFRELGALQMRGGPLAVDTLATPVRVDWDGDGLPDLIVGDASGWLTFWKGTADEGVYRAGVPMHVNGTPIHHQAGMTGSIQGPNEKRWGYLQPTVGDWNNDGTLAIITNDIEGYLTVYRPAGGEDAAALLPAKRLQKDGADYRAAWRSRPAIIPARYAYAGKAVPSLLHMDYDGELAVAQPTALGSDDLAHIEKLAYTDGSPIVLCGTVGAWGRAELSVVDWDGDGRWDIVFGNIRGNHRFFQDNPAAEATPFLLKNVGTNAAPIFERARPILMADGSPMGFGIHTASVWPAFFEGSSLPGLIVGAEDGKIYRFPRAVLER